MPNEISLGFQRIIIVKTAILVHGLLRGPMSMMPLAGPLRHCGFGTHFFYYFSPIESMNRIVDRLVQRIDAVKPSIVIGHSLGGILLRLALSQSSYRVDHLVMLGTPNQSPRLARRLHRFLLFRLATGESGDFLADITRFESLPKPDTRYTNFAGTLGSRWLFQDEPNDGVVAVSETVIDREQPSIEVPTLHTFLSCSKVVREGVTQIARGL